MTVDFSRRILALTDAMPGTRNDKTVVRYDDFIQSVHERGAYGDMLWDAKDGLHATDDDDIARPQRVCIGKTTRAALPHEDHSGMTAVIADPALVQEEPAHRILQRKLIRHFHHRNLRHAVLWPHPHRPNEAS